MRVRPSRVRRLRIRKAMGNVALAGAVLVIGTGYLALQKNVTLVVDGRPEAVRTMSANVGELLSAQGIVLHAKDLVVPGPTTQLADGMTVVVDIDAIGAGMAPGASTDVGVWVMEGGDSPFAKLTAEPSENWFSASQPAGSSGTVNARVVVKGKDHDVLTNAATVRELLSAMGIDPDGRDRVLPSPRTPLHPGITVRFTDIEYRTRQMRVPIPHTTYTVYSQKLAPGQVRTIREGVDGVMLEAFRMKFVDGDVVSRRLLSRRVIQEAVPTRRVIGHRNQSTGTQVGEASWYDAPGTGLTAAHPSLPFGTVVTVTNLANGTSVRVVINDRGPFGGRVIDLSPEAFSAIATLGQGVCEVRLTW
jgi:uncharacterized protein YabE (DUF348 family)